MLPKLIVLVACRLETSDKAVLNANKEIEKQWAEFQIRTEDATRSRYCTSLPSHRSCNDVPNATFTALAHRKPFIDAVLLMRDRKCLYTGKVLPGHACMQGGFSRMHLLLHTERRPWHSGRRRWRNARAQ